MASIMIVTKQGTQNTASGRLFIQTHAPSYTKFEHHAEATWLFASTFR